MITFRNPQTDERLKRMRRKLLIFMGIATAISAGISSYQLTGLLFTEYLYEKDFVQYFLMGHALRSGANLYSPISELAAQFDPDLNKWFNVSAYPPIVAVVGLPLSYLPYFWSVIAWMLFEVACLGVVIFLIIKHFGGRSASTPVLVTICLFIGWRPLYVDLYLGQLMIPILLLLTLCWLALKQGRDLKAGLLLGCVIAIKLYAWPLALFLLLKGRWRACLATIIVFLTANGLMMGWVGRATVYDYYFRVGSKVLAEYQFDPFNFSAWCIGLRSFGVVGAVTMVTAVLLGSLYLALRSKDFDSGFMVMLAAATVLQPISWIHYLITLLPAFCLMANRQKFERYELFLGLFLVLLILPGFHSVAYTHPPMATWPPFLFIIGLIWLIGPKIGAAQRTLSNLAVTAETA